MDAQGFCENYNNTFLTEGETSGIRRTLQLDMPILIRQGLLCSPLRPNRRIFDHTGEDGGEPPAGKKAVPVS